MSREIIGFVTRVTRRNKEVDKLNLIQSLTEAQSKYRDLCKFSNTIIIIAIINFTYWNFNEY